MSPRTCPCLGLGPSHALTPRSPPGISIAIALLSHHLTQAAAMHHGPLLWRDKEPGDLSSYPSPTADTLCDLGKPLTLWTSVSSSVK